MSKHTPGPWFVMNGSDIFTGIGAKNAEGTEAPSNDGWMIADCDMGGLSYDEVIANARLIAHAPRLLEALEQIAENDQGPAGYIARAAIEATKGNDNAY